MLKRILKNNALKKLKQSVCFLGENISKLSTTFKKV